MLLRRRWPQIVLGLMMALYLAYFGWFTLRAYDAFVYQAYDLGIYDQAIWNTAHGQPFRSTFEEPYDILLGDHFEPILLPLALLYLVWDSPKVLLLVQAAGLALGALPVYWLAQDALNLALSTVPAGGRTAVQENPESKRGPISWPVSLLALLFAGAYLLYPPVHAANAFEFHPSALAIPFLLCAILFLRRRNMILYFTFIILTMATKEVMPLTTAAVGLYALLVEKKRRAGLWTMVLSALWFGLVVFVAIPYFSPENQSQYFGEFYGWLGGSAGEIFRRLIAHPEIFWQRLVLPDSLSYVNALLRSTAYVSLLGLPALLGALPGLFLNLLSDWPPQHDPLNFYQYAAPIAPFVVVAAIDGTAFVARQVVPFLRRIGLEGGSSSKIRLSAAILLTGSMWIATLAAQRYHGYTPWSQDYGPPVATEQARAAQTIAHQVPPESSVSADLVFGPYLSHRKSIFIFPALHDADYLVIDACYRDSPFNPRDRFDAIQDMLVSGQYGVVDGRYGYLLLQRNGTQQAIPEPFYDFARAVNPAPQIRTDVVFGDELQLIGFDMVWSRSIRPHANLVLYWRALRPVPRDVRLFFILTDPSGSLLPGTELEFDTSVWYPVTRWSETEIVRTETARWPLEYPRRFGVAIAAVEGPGFWDTDKRLHPQLRTTPWAMPRLHDGSLVWIATLATDGRVVALEPSGAE